MSNPEYMLGRIIGNDQPAPGPPSSRTYTCRFKHPSGGYVNYEGIRLQNDAWPEYWDTLPCRNGTRVIAFWEGEAWNVCAFGPCEVPADCGGGGDGAGGTGARPRPGTAGGVPIIPPPGGGTGGTGTIGPSTGPPVGGGGFE